MDGTTFAVALGRSLAQIAVKLDLTDEEHQALTAYLKAGIAADKFPLSPRLKPIKTVLAKLDPPKPKVVKPEIPSAPKRGKTKQRR